LPFARPSGNDAKELVTQYEGLRELGVPDAAFTEPVTIGTAEPDSGDTDQELIVVGCRFDFVVQAKVTGVMESQRSHVVQPSTLPAVSPPCQ
jgi:hypothetical protein